MVCSQALGSKVELGCSLAQDLRHLAGIQAESTQRRDCRPAEGS